jgi:hypothetical protein
MKELKVSNAVLGGFTYILVYFLNEYYVYPLGMVMQLRPYGEDTDFIRIMDFNVPSFLDSTEDSSGTKQNRLP